MTPHIPLENPAITEGFAQVRARIARAEVAAGRPAGSVTLLAVSKTQPVSSLQAAISAGQVRFGENYLQESLLKMEALAFEPSLEWHFIGALQSNKTKPVAEHFHWVHSVSSLKLAKRLSEQRPDHLPPLNVCLQVNISEETTKSGVRLEDATELVKAMAPLPRLRLRGLMTLPKAGTITEVSADPYQRMEAAFHEIAQNGLAGPHFDSLSMGMSGDLEVAIAHGATLVRVGTALFGSRQEKHKHD